MRKDELIKSFEEIPGFWGLRGQPMLKKIEGNVKYYSFNVRFVTDNIYYHELNYVVVNEGKDNEKAYYDGSWTPMLEYPHTYEGQFVAIPSAEAIVAVRLEDPEALQYVHEPIQSPITLSPSGGPIEEPLEGELTPQELEAQAIATVHGVSDYVFPIRWKHVHQGVLEAIVIEEPPIEEEIIPP